MSTKPALLGFLTRKSHPLDRAAAKECIRENPVFGCQEEVEPGARFFVLALEALGAKTRASCEGHPYGFYVAFEGTYELALKLAKAGFFTVEVIAPNQWAVRLSERATDASDGGIQAQMSNHALTLRCAADSWVATFPQELAGF